MYNCSCWFNHSFWWVIVISKLICQTPRLYQYHSVLLAYYYTLQAIEKPLRLASLALTGTHTHTHTHRESKSFTGCQDKVSAEQTTQR